MSTKTTLTIQLADLPSEVAEQGLANYLHRFADKVGDLAPDITPAVARGLLVLKDLAHILAPQDVPNEHTPEALLLAAGLPKRTALALLEHEALHRAESALELAHAERDEARREICQDIGTRYGNGCEGVALERGWAYLYPALVSHLAEQDTLVLRASLKGTPKG